MNKEYIGIAPMSAEECLEILNANTNCYGEYLKVKLNLKALEIIKEKMVIPAYIVNAENVEEYNKWLKGIAFKADWLKRILTEEEFKLLKEVLK